MSVTMQGCANAKYLVLHFLCGQLFSIKVVRSWRGAQASRRNHAHRYDHFPAGAREHYDPTTRILPVTAILAMQGLEGPDDNLGANDRELLKRMGIGL